MKMNHDRNPLFEALNFKQKRVLEVGPGDGVFTRRYLPEAAEIVCVEPNEGIFEALQSDWLAAGHSARLSLINGRFEEVDLPPQAFDFVIFAHSF